LRSVKYLYSINFQILSSFSLSISFTETNHFSMSFSFSYWNITDNMTNYMTDQRFSFLVIFLSFYFGLCGRLSWLNCQLSSISLHHTSHH